MEYPLGAQYIIIGKKEAINALNELPVKWRGQMDRHLPNKTKSIHTKKYVYNYTRKSVKKDCYMMLWEHIIGVSKWVITELLLEG